MAREQTRKQAEAVSLAEFRRGTDENNLAEFPLTLLSDTAQSTQKTIEFQDTLKDWKTGQEITRRVCVTGSDKYGLPTAKDEQVLVALLQLTRIANKFTCPEVQFSKHQVIELLGWENSGWAYDRIEESLHRWKGVSVHYWNAWRDHESGCWIDTEAIGVIDYFRLTDGRRTQAAERRDSRSRFVWNRELFKSFQSGYLKPLDFGLYRSLKRPAARRAYRFLDKRFHHRPDWEFDLQTFACEKLGFSRKHDTGQLKARLHPAMAELQEVGFIRPVEYRKVRKKHWMIAISKEQVTSTPLPEAKLPPASKMAEQLVVRGVSASVAKELAETFPAKRIAEKIAFLDWLIARRDKRVSSNPAGFLVAAIRNDYAIPKDFSRSQVSQASTKQKAAPKPASLPKLEKDQAVQEYLGTLSVAEQSKLEVAAVCAADALTADGYHRSQKSGGPAFAIYQQLVVERYVRQLLITKKQQQV